MFKIIELFSGIGSQTQALKNLSIEHEVAAISEIDRFALMSYEALHGQPNNLGDIAKIDKLPSADLWTYSFPCQDISLAGKQAGIKEGTRSGLLYEVERLLRAAAESDTLPKYLLLENVKNLVGKKFRADFDKWLSFLSELGYTNYWQILNTRDYCIPQNRERVFCVSIRGEHTPYRFPEKRELRLRLKDMLDTEVDEKFYLSERSLNSLLNATYNTERGRVQDPDGVHRTMCARDYKSPTCIMAGELEGGKWDKMHDISKRVYDPNGISPTLHCAGGGNTEPKVIDPQGRKTKYENQPLKQHTVCPTLRAETHGNPPQLIEPIIVDDTYQGREPRVYGDTAPTLRSGRHGFKVVAGQFQPINRDYKADGEQREEHFECRKDNVSNAVLTGDRKNCVMTMLTPCNWKHKAGDGMATRERKESDICPALQATPGSTQQSYVKIAALRGRNPDNPSDRTPGVHLEQRLEVNTRGLCNTLTSVQKDNLVIEPQVLKAQRTEYGKAVRKAYEAHEVDLPRCDMREQVPRMDGVSNTLTTVQKDNLVVEPDTFIGRGYKDFVDKKGYLPEMFNPYNRAEITETAPTMTTNCGSTASSATILKAETDPVAKTVRVGGHGWHFGHTWDVVEVKEATKKGYAEAEPGDFVNTQYPGSKTKRGRVGKGVSHTLQCGDSSAVVTDAVRIRKLTPWECLRLQGWRDAEIAKIRAAGVSNAQMYKQAGNGITTTVLMAIFGELFGVEYKNLLDEWRY